MVSVDIGAFWTIWSFDFMSPQNYKRYGSLCSHKHNLTSPAFSGVKLVERNWLFKTRNQGSNYFRLTRNLWWQSSWTECFHRFLLLTLKTVATKSSGVLDNPVCPRNSWESNRDIASRHSHYQASLQKSLPTSKAELKTETPQIGHMLRKPLKLLMAYLSTCIGL